MILPERRGLAPGYEQKRFEAAEKQGQLRLVASPDGRDGSITVHQDVDLYASVLVRGMTPGWSSAPDATHGSRSPVAR